MADRHPAGVRVVGITLIKEITQNLSQRRIFL
jgi:hypothetical protein